MISVLGLLWIVGTLFVLARLAFGTWRVGRLAKQGYRVADGEWLSLAQRLANRLDITRPLTLLRGESLAVPVTWGVVYPAVLLPPDSDEWPEARRRFVLVHEMAHVKRFDALTQLLAQFAIALLWFDPLIWLAAHRMRVEREHACDDYVLRDGTAPSLYAGELLEMVRSIGSPRHESAAPAFAALAMARRSEFEGRMLAILDPKQERHTLGRRSAIAASLALALLVIPLAALRPFQNSSPESTAKMSAAAEKKSATPKTYVLTYGDDACETAWKSGKRGASIHSHVDDSSENSFIEYLIISDKRCLQAAIIGKATFYEDRMIALPADAYAFFKEVSATGSKGVKITSDNGALRYAAKLNGNPAPYDDSMRSWLAEVMPEVLRDASIEVPARVARDMKSGGVDAVLRDIATIESNAAKTTHYQALLKTPSLTSAQYDKIARQAGRELASSPSDLDAVLTLIAGTPTSGTRALERAVGKLAAAQATMAEALGTALKEGKSSGDSAATFQKYAETDDPEMILMALRGAPSISSDGDKRVLLQVIAPKVLGKKDARLRNAFFDAAATIESDTDLRVLLQDALAYGKADSAVTLAAFRLVGSNMESDTDRRVTLTTAAEMHLLTTPALRAAYMTAAKKMTSSSDYMLTMQAALKQ
jgi:beta-lactamase regulating signal transducer with metallopeptidase domain